MLGFKASHTTLLYLLFQNSKSNLVSLELNSLESWYRDSASGTYTSFKSSTDAVD